MSRPVFKVFLVSTLCALPVIASATDQRFASPAGNISCNINQFVATCTIDEYQASFTDAPPDCDGIWGNTFYVLGRGEAEVGCLTAAEAAPERVLGYGQRIETGRIACISRLTGITCTNTEGRGFSVRRAEQRIF